MLKNLSINKVCKLSLIKRQQGFTLVELLVAIAIIAILAVIGLTVFTGLQRGARDAQRRSDVEAIAKALEANYDTTSAQYPLLLNTMFAGGRLPVDPLTTTHNCATAQCMYCIDTATGGDANPTDTSSPIGSDSACGDVGAAFNGTTVVSITTPAVGTTGFLICANLEGGAGNVVASHYCQGSQR